MSTRLTREVMIKIESIFETDSVYECVGERIEAILELIDALEIYKNDLEGDGE
jgi:hypothetical protein